MDQHSHPGERSEAFSSKEFTRGRVCSDQLSPQFRLSSCRIAISYLSQGQVAGPHEVSSVFFDHLDGIRVFVQDDKG